jgi:hypothetical protein
MVFLEFAKIGIFGTGFAARGTSGIEDRSSIQTLITIVALLFIQYRPSGD